MNIGKQVRLNRLFSHPSGRLCSVAVDHFINYGAGIPAGLRDIVRTITQIVAGRPDAITMHRGIATTAWQAFAGKVPFILQSSLARPDDSCMEQIADPEDAVRMGADAFAVVGLVCGSSEGRHLKVIAECVKAAARFDMPVICHIYPRRFGKTVEISFDPEDVAWAVRCALECGADVIKTPYCNDVKAFGQIVSETPVPVVAAGGHKTKTMEQALAMLQDVVRSGAKGATIGRNIWGNSRVTQALCAVKLVVHDEKSPREALRFLACTSEW